MTVPRALWVFAMLIVVGIAMVAIRAESARAANRIQKLHQKQLVYEQTLWTQEMELARLRAPEEIRKRAEAMGLSVRPPPVDPGIRSDNTRPSD